MMFRSPILSLLAVFALLTLFTGVAEAQQFVGPQDNSIGAGSNTNASYAQVFEAHVPLEVESVYIYPGGSGANTVGIDLLDDSTGAVLESRAIPISSTVPQRVDVNFQVQPGTYRIAHVPSVSSVSGLFRNTSGAVYPYEIPGVLAITGSTFSNVAYYYYFYDWAIIAGPSLRVEDLASAAVFTQSGQTLDVGAASANTQATRDLELQNADPNDTLDVNSISVANESNVTGVQVNPGSVLDLDNASPETMQVEYTPDASGAFSFTLVFDHSGTNTNPFELEVEGFAGPRLAIEDGSGAAIADGATHTPDGTFASQQSATVSVELHSTGSDELDVDSISTYNTNNVVVHSVSPTSYTAGNEIAAGTNQPVTVEFTPQAPGTFSFDLTVSSNDAATPSYTITISDGSVFGPAIYTVDNSPGANANFDDIGDAISALHTFGVSGPVVFEIQDDGSGYTSTSDYVFSEIPGASSSNTITMRAANGHRPRIIGAGAPTNLSTNLGALAAIAFQQDATGIRLQGIEFDIDGAQQGIVFYSSVFNQPMSNIIIDGCYFHGSSGTALAGYANATNRVMGIVVQNCWFWDNAGDITGSSSTSVMTSRGTVSIVRWEGGHFRHNTIFASGSNPAVYMNFLTSRTLDRFDNNIVVYEGDGAIVERGGTVDLEAADGNIYWGPDAAEFNSAYADFESWQSAGFDEHGMLADPYLRDPHNGDLRIAIDSPAKDAAKGIIVQRDIFGTHRPVGMAADVGAEEAAPSEPGIGMRSSHGARGQHGGNLDLDSFGANVPLRYTLHVINERGATLNLTGSPQVELLGTNHATATIVTQPEATYLGMGQLSAFEVEITATGLLGQIVEVELAIASDDAAFPQFEVTLTGEIISPSPRVSVERVENEEIEPFVGIDQLPYMLPIDRDREIVYTIRNTGSEPLQLTGSPLVEFPGYSGLQSAPILTQSPSAVIGVQSETTFAVRVRPNAQNFAFGVRILNDDSDLIRADYSFLVQGTAGPLPIARAVLYEVDFGRARAGEQRNEAVVYVANDGSGELQITGLKLHDATSSWRLVASNPPMPIYGSAIVLDPLGYEQDMLELTFEFAPQQSSPEPVSATLEVETNDPENEVVFITLTGFAAAPTVSSGTEGCALTGGRGGSSWLVLALAATGLGLLALMRRRIAA